MLYKIKFTYPQYIAKKPMFSNFNANLHNINDRCHVYNSLN